MDFVFLRRIR